MKGILCYTVHKGLISLAIFNKPEKSYEQAIKHICMSRL